MPISIAINTKRRRKLGLAERLWPYFEVVAEVHYFYQCCQLSLDLVMNAKVVYQNFLKKLDMWYSDNAMHQSCICHVFS